MGCRTPPGCMNATELSSSIENPMPLDGWAEDARCSNRYAERGGSQVLGRRILRCMDCATTRQRCSHEARSDFAAIEAHSSMCLVFYISAGVARVLELVLPSA